MIIFSNEDRKDIVESLWFWVRDKTPKDELKINHMPEYDRFHEQLIADRMTVDDPDIDPVLKDFMEKCDLFFNMEQEFHADDDFKQRQDFCKWLKESTGRVASSGFNPYDDPMDELYWLAYEFALQKKFY